MKTFEKWLENSKLEYQVSENEKGNKTFVVNGFTVYCAKGTRQAQLKQENGWKAVSYKKLIEELEK